MYSRDRNDTEKTIHAQIYMRKTPMLKNIKQMRNRSSIVGACKAGLGGVVVDGFARHIQSEPALFIVSTVRACGNMCALTIVAPMPTIRALMIVKAILRGEEKYRPQLRCNQYTPPRPTARVSCHCHRFITTWHLQLNQLANSALIKLNKLLKLGIPSAMIQAMIQQVNPMATQEPTETRS